MLMALKTNALEGTVKSCGPDAPTLALKSVEVCTDDSDKQARSPRKSTKEIVKTIARGMPGVFYAPRAASGASRHT